MADQFDANTIKEKLREKVAAIGFELNPDRSEMSRDVVTIDDMLDILGEALGDILYNDEDLTATIRASNIKLGPAGEQRNAGYKDALVKFDATTDPQFFTWVEALHTIIQGSYTEPGNGSPDVFAIAMKALLSNKPSSITGKIIQFSSTVKVTI